MYEQIYLKVILKNSFDLLNDNYIRQNDNIIDQDLSN